MKTIQVLSILLILIICQQTSFCKTSNDPEIAINTFIEKTKLLNLEEMLKCCAIDEYINNNDFAKAVAYTRSIILGKQVIPNQYKVYHDINRYNRISYFVEQLEFIFITLSINDPSVQFPLMLGDSNPNNEIIKKIIDKMNPKSIGNIKLLYIRNPIPKKDKNKMAELYKKEANELGADDSIDLVVLLDNNGETYILPFSLLKYNDNWLIGGFHSYYQGLNSISRMSKTEFLKRFPE